MSTSKTNWKVAGASILAIAFLGSGSVVAQTADSEQAYKSIDEIVSQLEADGFKVREIERDFDRYDVEGVDASNQRMEVVVDATTGEILRRERDDD
jgi:uncharacterized membrane protein YkoI